jgi:hypothetical protein
MADPGRFRKRPSAGVISVRRHAPGAKIRLTDAATALPPSQRVSACSPAPRPIKEEAPLEGRVTFSHVIDGVPQLMGEHGQALPPPVFVRQVGRYC